MKNNIIENLLIIYTADEGKLKILLKKKSEEPYKGYWILPSEILDSETTLEESSQRLFNKTTNIKSEDIFQGNIFSELDRNPVDRVIGITHIAITDKNIVDLKKENDIEWFDIDKLPKIGYDHKHIIEATTKDMKEKIIYNHSNILLDLFKSDFTLSELQKFYENIMGKTIDRRNFRKKILNQDLVIDTGEKTNTGTGRPGKLYRFNKENMKGKII